MTTTRPCLTCSTPTTTGPRCPAHQQQHDAARWQAKSARYRTGPNGRAWATFSRQAIAAHVATHGNTCPGYQRPPHHATDWVCDHDLGPMCRACNGVKAATTDKQRTPRGTTA